MTSKPVALLLNIAHAVDHMFLLIFAAAVGAIAADLGVARWEDLMPYGTGAFLLYGLGALPAGRLGDLWGRRSMMVLFFFGMGVSAMLCALVRTPWELAGAHDTDRCLRVDLPPGGHPDAGAACAAPGRDHRLERPGGQPGHRGVRAADRAS